MRFRARISNFKVGVGAPYDKSGGCDKEINALVTSDALDDLGKVVNTEDDLDIVDSIGWGVVCQGNS